jgi:hypothetical protein
VPENAVSAFFRGNWGGARNVLREAFLVTSSTDPSSGRRFELHMLFYQAGWLGMDAR